MENEQFASLGDRIGFDFSESEKTTVSKGKRPSLNLARRLTYVLFEEIIEDSPSQTRTVIFDPKRNEEDEELLESIKQHGIITPIIIRGLGKNTEINSLNQKKDDKRKFALVAGHRRVAAGRAAGLAGTEAVIAKSNEDYQLLTLVENMGRRELTSYEKGLALKNLKLRLKLSVRKVAELSGYSRTHVNRLISAFDSPEILQQLWQKGDISETVIDILKVHWQTFTNGTYDRLAKDIHKLTQDEAYKLRVQLDSGIDLKTAVHSARNRSESSRNSENNHKQSVAGGPIKKSIEDKILARNYKNIGLYKTIQKYFPVITEEIAKVLSDNAAAAHVLDADVVWVAALYVTRGGPLEQAMDVSIKLMQNQLYRKILIGDLKTIRQVAYTLKSKYLHSDLKEFLRTIYLGS